MEHSKINKKKACQKSTAKKITFIKKAPDKQKTKPFTKAYIFYY